MINLFKRKEKESSNKRVMPSGFKFMNLNYAQEQDILSLLAGNVSFDFNILYYENVYPVNAGINLITDEFSSLRLYLSDGTNLDNDADIIKWLNNEINPDKKKSEIFKELGAYYKITGNVFVTVAGPINKAPVSLDVISPKMVRAVSWSPQGYPEEYQLDMRNSQSMSFKAVHGLNGNIRYFNIKKTQEGTFTVGDVLALDSNQQPTLELLHIKDFDPSNYFGASALNGVRPEIDQYLVANTHNLSLLLKGGFFSGILSAPDMSSQDEMDQVKKDMQNCYSGSAKAGKIFITNTDMKFQETSMKTVDMNFRDLKEDNKAAIFQALKVPLPLVMPQTQTLNNYQESKFMLYDLAVLPLADKLFEELTALLAPRFGLTDNEFITYNPNEIPALQIRFNEITKIMKDTGIYSDNEMRAIGGWDSYPQGDIVYKPANLVPVGEDDNLDDNSNNSN